MVTKLTIPKKIKKRKEKAKADEEATADDKQESPVPLVTLVKLILHFIFSIGEMCINNQPIYNSNQLYAHKSYNFNNFKRVISENKGVLNCEGTIMKNIPMKVWKRLCLNLFSPKE